jgi:hypothetical protein
MTRGEPDQDLVQVRYTFQGAVGEVDTEYWLDTAQGNQPVLLRLASSTNDHLVETSIRVKLKEFELGQGWFPEEVVFRNRSGDEIRNEQTVSVESAEFNLDLDDSLFRLAGLDLHDGRLVLNDGQSMYWTGTELVAKELSQVRYQGNELDGREARPPRSRRWLLIVNAFALGAIGIALCCWRFFGRKSP